MAISDVTKRGRTWLIGAALIVLGVVVGHSIPQNSATPKAETGMATPVSSRAGSAVTFSFTPKGGSKAFYQLENPTLWQDKLGAWHKTGQPTCLSAPSTKPRPITIGVVAVQSSDSAPANSNLVAWVKCQG
jgi:hypothetical protein